MNHSMALTRCSAIINITPRNHNYKTPIIWSKEAEKRFVQRMKPLGITRDKINNVISEGFQNPDTQVVDGSRPNKPHIVIFQKRERRHGLMRIIVAIERHMIIICTMYYVSRAERYWNINVL